MRQKSQARQTGADRTIKDTCRATRKRYVVVCRTIGALVNVLFYEICVCRLLHLIPQPPWWPMHDPSASRRIDLRLREDVGGRVWHLRTNHPSSFPLRFFTVVGV